MRQPLTVRPLSEPERTALEACAASRGGSPFAAQRSQILLASSAGRPPMQIAAALGIDDETVRRAIRRFNSDGAEALIPRPPRPRRTGDRFAPGGRAALLALIEGGPRSYGAATASWTLELLADVAYAEGLTTARVSDETIRSAIARQGLPWGALKRHMRRGRRLTGARSRV